MKRCIQCGEIRPDYEINCGNCGGELVRDRQAITGDFSEEVSFEDLPSAGSGEMNSQEDRYILVCAEDERQQAFLPNGESRLGRDISWCSLEGLKSYLCRNSRKYVSARQAVILTDSGSVRIQDVGEHGMVFINHNRIQKQLTYSLKDGDLIGFGSDGNYGQYQGEKDTCAFFYLRKE